MRLINLLSTSIRLFRMDGTSVVLDRPADGTNLPRASVQTELTEPIEGLPVARTIRGPAWGLPEPEEGTIFVVRKEVVEAAPDRTDLYAPGPAVTDGKGVVLGARGLCR
jgi:hypothetical protein